VIIVKRTNKLTEANEKLKELDQLKNIFIRNMSHELRTPLTSITGFTGMILKRWVGEINEEQEKQLTIILKSANKLLELINDLIDESKIEAGKLDIKKEEYDLVDELKTLEKTFILDAEKKNLKFLMNTPESLIIFNDKRRINQILTNLIANAIKFTDNGKISLYIQKLNSKIKISVEDTGPGIKDEDFVKLFKPFSRIIKIGNYKEGTGLGLDLSQKLAHILGGDISVESEFGKGSTFTLSLKIAEEEISD
jgi:signal transduction histidine kinase